MTTTEAMQEADFDLLDLAHNLAGTGRSPGCCERCGSYGMVCLNGQRFLCWEHYCDEARAAGVVNRD